ncbi:CLIP-domain serine protease subfamily B-like protein [Leptotrombidium deliense]|uniref:CLIP-domain serine protease subfamily B-like protein n=1 Tax=Leptotrombidium deliense TaxID=299467 RepID=A0A443S7R1_9ACAR|nr:CLIP-domain serine protease subfamily B-like protein [Leptotrombidium deliense]
MNYHQHAIFATKIELYDESYKDAPDPHDIALLTLKKPVKFNDYVSTICLPDKSFPKHFDNLIVAGWGITSLTDSFSKTLKTSDDLKQSDQFCSEIYPATTFNEDIFMCAKSVNNVCFGDSGGPLMTRKRGSIYVVGIGSFSKQCDYSYPPVFTRVTYYLDWIRAKTIPGAQKCPLYSGTRNPPKRKLRYG